MLHPVAILDAVDSTNSEAQRRAAGGESGPLWIRAKRQSSGRGRSGRTWLSPPGNLYATLLFRPDCAADQLHHLSLVAGLAVHDAARTSLVAAGKDQAVRLKWPNDVMVDTAKLAGILVESSIFNGVTVAAVGIGMNVTVAPQVGGRDVTSLHERGATISAQDALEILDETVFRHLATWQHGAGFARIRELWLERTFPPGQSMAINTPDGPVQGTFHSIDEEGALLLRESSGTVRRFHFGDVVVGGDATAQNNAE